MKSEMVCDQLKVPLIGRYINSTKQFVNHTSSFKTVECKEVDTDCLSFPGFLNWGFFSLSFVIGFYRSLCVRAIFGLIAYVWFVFTI